MECQSSYERGDLATLVWRRKALSLGVNVKACTAPRTKGGARWTLIVRAEVGPFRRYPCQLLAHADLPALLG